MKYIETKTGEYPISERQIKNRFPDVSFPKKFSPPEGYKPVNPTKKPVTDWYHDAKELSPTEKDGVYVQVWEVVEIHRTPEEEEEHINEAKAAKLKEVLAKSDETLNALAYRYSENEKLSWAKQEVEARALEADPEAPAPLLRGIAATRGIDVIDLAAKVIANVKQSEQATSYVLGTQQKYEDVIKAATTVDELSFDIDYTLAIV